MNDTFIIERDEKNISTISLNSKLYENNIIFIDSDIDDESSQKINKQLLYLISKREPGYTIKIYINSYGGILYNMLSIYDMINIAKNKGFIVETVCIGVAMSAAAILLLSGTPGKRFSLSNSTIMLHQASGGNYGKVNDMIISCEELVRLNNKMFDIIEKNSKFVLKDKFTDTFLTPEQAIEYSIIDSIL